MLAAIMLVIGGSPALAASTPCDPCPPDCAMMRAAASADQQAKAPQQQEKPSSPCKASIVCQTALAMPVLPQAVTIAWVMPHESGHPPITELAAASRPPDRALRPPIQL